MQLLYRGGVNTCPECGNHDMRVRVVDGTPVHECGMCFAHFGERAAVDALDASDEAKARGFDREVWPLVAVLESLRGLVVHGASAGDAKAATLPYVDLGVAGWEALVQVENLAKSLQLASSALRLHWVIEVEYQHHLAFVMKPRHGGGGIDARTVTVAHGDLDLLGRRIQRDSRLSWWRHAAEPPSG